MRFIKSLLLLAALSRTTLARHGHHGHHGDHARRQVGRTITITTTETTTVCPCESSSSSIDSPIASSTLSKSRSVQSTTSTSTETLNEPATTLIPATTSSTFTTLSRTKTIFVTSTSTSTLTLTLTSASTTSTSTTSTSTTSTSTTSTSTTSTSTTSTSTSTASTNTKTNTNTNLPWTATPSNNEYSTTGFGKPTKPTGSGDTYTGNVGNPYGSNIIEVPATAAHTYKYVVQFRGPATSSSPWTVVIWNKIAPNGKMGGWYNNACHTFTLSPNEKKYYAFDTDSQGAWAAAPGSSIPTDAYGGYAATWGEFDFGSCINDGWSGFDVSAIQAENAGLTVQGMKICSVLGGGTCSVIEGGAGIVRNAYTVAEAALGGIGGNLVPGPVRLAVTLDYSG